MLVLANLVWCPHIHSDIVAQAQGCKHCIETDKNLLKMDILSYEELWRREGLSEDNLDIQYKDREPEATYTIDSDESNNLP